jgi:Sigma-70 region 2
MDRLPNSEIHCTLCNRPVDLQTDLNTDENGSAVHENCYAQILTVRSPSDDRDEDSAWLARVGLGDQRAIASLYDRHSTLVYSVALRVCRDPALAEEVLQNIFMQMWLAPRKFCIGRRKARWKAWNVIEEPRNRSDATPQIQRTQ